MSKLFYLRKPRYLYPESVRQKAIAFYENGNTYKETADLLGPSSSTIWRWVQDEQFRRKVLRESGGADG